MTLRRYELLAALQTVQDALLLGMIGLSIAAAQRQQIALHIAILKHGLQASTAEDAEERAEKFLADIRRIQP